MPFYLVKLRREIEFEDYIEAESEGLAVDLVKLEANAYGAIVEEQMTVTEVHPAMEVD